MLGLRLGLALGLRVSLILVIGGVITFFYEICLLKDTFQKQL